MILVTQWEVRPERNIRLRYLSLLKAVSKNIEGALTRVSKLSLIQQYQSACQTEQQSPKKLETLKKS